jgi:polysaccharide biosynthesis protein PslG
VRSLYSHDELECMLPTMNYRLLAALLGLQLSLAQPRLPEPVVPEGFGLHLMRWNSAEDLDNTIAAGFKVVRLILSWSLVERQKGVYDFVTPGYDATVQRCADRGLRMMLEVGGRNRLYGSMHNEEAWRGLAAYARAASERYRGKGALWDIWNEPNFESFWEVTRKPRFGIVPTPAAPRDADDFAHMTALVAASLHAGDPTGIVVAPSTSEIRLERDYEEELFRSGLLDSIDAFAVHPYRKQPPDTSFGDYAALRLLMRRFGKEVPIVQGEWGYSLVNWDRTALTEETKAQFLVRMMLTSLYADVRVCLWHTLYDMKTTNERENNFGIMTVDHKPKPAYIAARTLNTTLAGYRYIERMDLGLFTDYDYALRFRKGTQVAIAFWTTEAQHQAVLPVGPGEGVLIDIMGNRRPVVWQTDGWEVDMTGSPQYLILKTGTDH